MTAIAGDRSPTGERRVPLQGAHNCRDLGGLPCADGRVLRAGRVLRGDSTAGFTPDDVTYLVEVIGLRTVLDLRTPQEVLAHPSQLPGRGLRHVNLPIRSTGGARDDIAPALGGDRLAVGYQSYLEGSAPSIVAALELLAEPGSAPVLVHCTAGKDRTGVVVAMLLAVLGVPQEHIVADYAATDPNMPGVVRRIRASSLFRANGVADLPAWVFRADPATMREFLNHLGDVYGGALQWLATRGLSPRTVHALRDGLLTED